MDTNRNTFLAIVLSMIVIVAWQFLYVSPRMDAEKKAAEAQRRLTEQTQQANQPTNQPAQGGSEASNLPTPEGTAVAPSGGTLNELPESASLSRDSALAKSPRIRFDNPLIAGSINLKGARFDDIQLKKYRETIEKDSSLITLLSPSDQKDGYFAEFGYVGSGTSGDVPGPDTVWNAPEGASLAPGKPVKLTWSNTSGVTFERTISVDETYLFTVSDKVVNNSAQEAVLSPYGRVTRFSKPKVASTYILHEGLIGVFGDEGLQQMTYSSLEDDKELQGQKSAEGWIGITDKYWAAALVPNAGFKPRFAYFSEGRPRWQADYLGDPITVAAGQNLELKQLIFAGAKEVATIDEYEKEHGIKNFELLIDWGWFYFITKPMFWLLDWLYKLVGNFGIAILLGTVIIKGAVFPLANMSYKSMAQMKKLQPEMTAMRERYADDKVKQQQEMMALYKREKINPAAGCWPILIQIPIFFALYKVLFITIEMRHAPFFGWIQDLAAPDPTSMFNLFGLLPFEVPAFLLIGVWPLIMGITMFLQMQMNPAPPDPTQAMIFKWMPIVFTFMLATFPAGLVIYWAWNNTLSIIQQAVIMRKYGTKIELIDNLRKLTGRNPNPSK
ncbi:MAG: membrane protein insertase YidC [Rhizobiaceae bacterium]